MPLQNRVDPFGHDHAVTARGMFMGNRGGCFHRDDRTLKPTHWANRQWITCRLEFKGRKRELMAPGLYTELFFLDEATALAAGHRPCYECRRADAQAFREALMARDVFTEPPLVGQLNDGIAGEVQARLKERRTPPTGDAADLPDGAMFSEGETAWLKLGAAAHRWSFEGYGSCRALPEGPVAVLTPAMSLEALRGGYRPALHPSVSPPAG